MEPRTEPAVPPERRQGTPGADERLLADIGSQLPVAGQSERQREHLVLMDLYQPAERVTVAVASPVEQVVCLRSDLFGPHRVTPP